MKKTKNVVAAMTRSELILSKFQQMSEAEFTITILIPLFKLMGYEVDYHGGQNEGGKDFICRRGGDFGLQEVSVVQVKKTTAATAVAKSNSFAGIVSQLQQAAEKRIPSLSGQEQLPNSIYFVTPFEIDTRALETRFEALQGLASRGVRILDGRVIVGELLAKLPLLADELCGDSFAITDRLLSNLSMRTYLAH